MARHWTIRPLCFGEFPAIEKSGFTYGVNQGVKINIPAVGWLLQSGEEAILVDTGPGDPETAHPSHSKLQRSPEQVPDAALRAAGVAPERLKLVIFTHLHWDHSCNVHFFPEARFVVQAEELKAAVDPVLPQRAMYEFGLPGTRPEWLAVWDRFQVVRGDVNLVPGIRLVHFTGHTPGLQAVLVDTARGPHLIASDMVNLYECIAPDRPDPILPGIHTDVVACERSIERIRTLAQVILPSHDWQVLRQPVYPVAE